jgi:hypothetical protein
VAIVLRKQEGMDMGSLSELAKNKIREVLGATSFAQSGFAVRFDDENDPLATITFSPSPECQFVIHSTDDGAFTTNESPGAHSDTAETFRRSDFELCVEAMKQWTERVIARQGDWILDEFGGVADSNPSYK